MAGDIHLVRFSPQAVTLLEHINRITGKFDLVFAGEAKPWKPMSENTDFDYGRQLSYAGLQALKDMFGGGHYGTVKAHSDRWQAFAKWCRSDQRPGINDTRQIDRKLLADYAAYLRDIVKRGDLAVSTAQNRLSSVNRTMAALRGDQCVQVLSPSKALAMQRCNVR